ncbi:DUF3048 domain-containing protein [Streptomyces cavernae]|uniref:DUF3048 domain-containing protein n=1 Tax=Streptomyces cavernae TaxID=2259034 RepID=UPI00192E5016|nr:DUF3048 domain-containing protein [Streptomyces cavernae]
MVVKRLRHGALTAVLLTALVAGCTTGDGEGTDTGREETRQSTGEPTGPVLAVKIDNVSAARPQTGIGAADIVYVEQVEGGLSRLMAVYATRLPEVVGPVRSARETDLELLRQFDEPTLAFSGAQGKLLPLIDREPLRAVPPGKASGAYFRGEDRPAPHNLYLRPAKVMESVGGGPALAQTGFRFGAAPEGGTPQNSRTVRFPAARFTFTWSEQRQSWQVAMDGTPDRTTDGKTLAPATVVVQYVRVRESRFHDVRGNNSPYTETVGSGKADVLRDGRVHRVRWERGAAQDGTEFTTADGKTVNFARGQVWVLLVAAR